MLAARAPKHLIKEPPSEFTQLVGTWEVPPAGSKATCEYLKDDRIVLRAQDGSKPDRFDGTYTLSDGKLTHKADILGSEVVTRYIIVSITETTMVAKNSGDEERGFVWGK